jgi:hypothetical protein
MIIAYAHEATVNMWAMSARRVPFWRSTFKRVSRTREMTNKKCDFWGATQPCSFSGQWISKLSSQTRKVSHTVVIRTVQSQAIIEHPTSLDQHLAGS